MDDFFRERGGSLPYIQSVIEHLAEQRLVSVCETSKLHSVALLTLLKHRTDVSEADDVIRVGKGPVITHLLSGSYERS